MELQELEQYKKVLYRALENPSTVQTSYIKDFLTFVRGANLRESNLVSTFGSVLLKKSIKLNNEGLQILEQVAIASMDVGNHKLSKECLDKIKTMFPKSNRLRRLKAMMMESQGLLTEALREYQSLLKEDHLDTVSMKRLVCIAKARNEKDQAIILLKEYLSVFVSDAEAWLELADLYFSLNMFQNAAFCMEELITISPQNYHYYVKYAEILYTIGGVDNWKMARKYYSFAIELSEKNNLRALYGLIVVTNALTNAKVSDSTNEKLSTLASDLILKSYKETRNDTLLGLAKETIKELQLK